MKLLGSLIIYMLLMLGFCQNPKPTTQNTSHFNHLSEFEKSIIVNKGTEAPFSGEYDKHCENGLYHCKACMSPLFRSADKFNSNCGWPSFDDEIDGAIKRKTDYSGGMVRTEIMCSNCGGHLGHVFEGELLTDKNLRHCVNSISLEFKPSIFN